MPHPNADRRWKTWTAKFGKQAASHMARLGAGAGVTAADLVQETFVRFCQAQRDGKRVSDPEAWLHGTLRRVIADSYRALRRSTAAGRIASLEDLAQEPASEARWSCPESVAILAELREIFPELLTRLPPPCREIAALRIQLGLTNREIRRRLRTWRPIGEEEARRLVARTRALLLALGRGQKPAVLWPGAWDARKNPWLRLPPPHPIFTT